MKKSEKTQSYDTKPRQEEPARTQCRGVLLGLVRKWGLDPEAQSPRRGVVHHLELIGCINERGDGPVKRMQMCIHALSERAV